MSEQKTIAFFPEAAFGPALDSVGIAQTADAAFFPAGWTGTCEVLETVRKTYMVRRARLRGGLLPVKRR